VYMMHGGSLRRFSVTEDADPNDLAMTVALALPMAWFLGMTHPKPLVRWLCRAFLPVGLVVIGLTGSRGGMLAALVGLLIVPLTMTRLSPGRLAMAITALGLSGALAIAYIPERTMERLASTGTEVEDLSVGGRFKLWRAGVIAFTEKPVMGWGTSGFITAVRPMLGVRSQVAHNSFLSLLVEQGIIGFLLYMAMLAAAFSAVLKLPRLERRFALVLMATLGTTMMPLTWEDQKSVWLVLAILVGFSATYATTGRAALATSAPYYPPQPAGSPSLAARSTERWPSSTQRWERTRRP
jgi:O-antigen ligase